MDNASFKDQTVQMGANLLIKDVSDTAIWVATYRAIESERKDALFHDPLAARLVGEKGPQIVKEMHGSRYTQWSVVTRTCIIDSYLHELIEEYKIDTILNLGAGLDTRPYRMALPKDLHWIEMDYPHIIEHKNSTLRHEKPTCQLERISIDLADEAKRRKTFSEINSGAKKILVLTEGVVPYLNEVQVASLAKDLLLQTHFDFWILDYFSPDIAKYFRKSRFRKQMKNAPFQFFPADWFGFFQQQGWMVKEIRYLMSESIRLGRALPVPWIFKLLGPFMGRRKRAAINKFTGYVVLKRS